MLAALIACGVDVERTCLYFQEDVSLVIIDRADDRSRNMPSWHGC
jgi:hypothetical protein